MTSTANNVTVPYDPHATLRQLYTRLLLRRRNGWRPGDSLPRLTMQASLNTDANQLEAYQQLCQLPTSRKLPLLYPHAMLGRMHLQLVAAPEFPLGALGLLHLRNHVTRLHQIDRTAPLDVACRITAHRVVEKGLEIDLDSQVRVSGEIAWHSISTILKRGKFGQSTETAQDAASQLSALPTSTEFDRFDIPSDMGRQYARLSGDYNLLHVSPMAAKLFGFRTAIAHGMWATARGLSKITESNESNQLDLSFKGPVFLGSSMTVRQNEERFDFFCGENPRPVICARLCQIPVDRLN